MSSHDPTSWYTVRFGQMGPTLLMCYEDGEFPYVRYGYRDHHLHLLTVFTALTWPG